MFNNTHIKRSLVGAMAIGVAAFPAAAQADMFATVWVAEGLRNVFILPATAVLHEGDKTYVFLVDASGKYSQRVVTVGRSIARASSARRRSLADRRASSRPAGRAAGRRSARRRT